MWHGQPRKRHVSRAWSGIIDLDALVAGLRAWRPEDHVMGTGLLILHEQTESEPDGKSSPLKAP